MCSSDLETIDQLIDKGFVSDPADIFYLTDNEFSQLDLFKEKKIDNALSSIENGKKVPLDRFIFALGIRHIGRETAEILARRLKWKTEKLTIQEKQSISSQQSLFVEEELEKTLEAIRLSEFLNTLQSYTSDELKEIEGIGEIVAKSLADWISNEDHRALIHKFENGGVVCLLPKGTTVDQIFSSQTFVLTGTLPSLSREEAKKMIKDRGGKVSSTVSKNTDYVLAGEEAGSKLDKANELNISVLTESEFISQTKNGT